MGDLAALQSEPRREQTERVILLLHLSAAAFVQVRNVTGDRGAGRVGGVGGLEKRGPWGSLRAQGSAGKRLRSRQAKHWLQSEQPSETWEVGWSKGTPTGAQTRVPAHPLRVERGGASVVKAPWPAFPSLRRLHLQQQARLQPAFAVSPLISVSSLVLINQPCYHFTEFTAH